MALPADRDDDEVSDSALAAAKDPGLVAQRIEYLFAKVQPLGRPYTNKEVAALIRDLKYKEGNLPERNLKASETGLHNLRRGKTRQPGEDYYRGLARVFGVKIKYFIDDDEADGVDDDLAFLENLKDHRVRSIAFRLATGSPDQRQLVEQILDGIDVIKAQAASKGKLPPPTSGK